MRVHPIGILLILVLVAQTGATAVCATSCATMAPAMPHHGSPPKAASRTGVAEMEHHSHHRMPAAFDPEVSGAVTQAGMKCPVPVTGEQWKPVLVETTLAAAPHSEPLLAAARAGIVSSLPAIRPESSPPATYAILRI